jgi:hypothetical protein
LGYDGVVYITEEYYSDCWVIIQPYIETDVPPIAVASYNTVIQNICTAGVGSICPECLPTPTPSITPSNTPTPTNTPSNTVSGTLTTTPTPTNTPSNTVSGTLTTTPTPTNTPSNTVSGTLTTTPTPTNTPSNTVSGTLTPTPTNSQTSTPTNTPSNTVSGTFTPTPTCTCSGVLYSNLRSSNNTSTVCTSSPSYNFYGIRASFDDLQYGDFLYYDVCLSSVVTDMDFISNGVTKVFNLALTGQIIPQGNCV